MTATPQAVAAYGLAPGERALGAVAAEEWPALLDALTRQRVTGHAVAAAHAGVLVLTDEQWRELVTRHEEQLALDLRIEHMLVECDTRLERAGIHARVLKGPALAHRFYPDPALRSFGDGDMLVDGADLDTAIDVLAEAGWRRRFAAPRRAFDRRFVKAVTLVGDEGLELDLHRALTPGPFGVLFDVDVVLNMPVDRVLVGPRALRCLSPELTLAHACAHAVLGDATPRLVPVRDVVQLLPSVDEPLAIATFERFSAGIVAARAIALVESVLGVRPDGAFADWARTVPVSRTDRWRLESYTSTHNRYARQAAATFWTIPSLRDRVSYASALAFPQRGYLVHRHESYPRRVLRSAVLAVRGRPR
jgi:hypothetical protein